jgi:ubiquinone biosynthesis accessory factor UbiJ
MAALLPCIKAINIDTMKKLIFSSLNKAINSYLALDPESQLRIKQLHGKTIAIEFLPFHLTFLCQFSDDGIHIFSNDNHTTDTTICGTPIQMVGVMIAKENRHRFFAEDIVIEGNAELGQQVVDLFDHIHIDWEDHLSKIVGDVPAYHAGRIFHKFNSWLEASENSLSENINEYVHEEAKWLPAREALQDFFSGVDITRMDIDRMDARIKALTTIIDEDEVNK